ncbi:transglutaminase-like domain-containing protein [Hymenobacter cellulosilyticus]|uniref:Transglutaminase domain-containing protein n=1 Tax=Hymenobacter cellulosilyticus TaxID=2932248 RepID=A0A8T9Q5V5_9BACT|nr:transglutaminase domain-containing protein [Hymenobacter cellulosilyticus]UOQ73036.1 transglutaminase domain-containing protein [Hymenobacter cellulosilyticus]
MSLFSSLPKAFSFLLLAGTLLSWNGKSPVSTAPVRARTFAFEYTATVKDLPAQAKETDLWIPVPHSDKSQDINNLVISSPYPYELLDAAHGNKVLHLRVLNPEPTSFSVSMKFDATRREHKNPVLVPEAGGKKEKEAADPDMQRWLQADQLVPLDDKIRLWAQEVVAKAKAKTDLEKAQAIYNHVVSTVKYDKTGQGWGRGDIYYACDARRGNCTDFHAVFIGYCRAVGIPARFSIGFPLPTERGEGEVKGYHCWAEFYTKATGWVPVDASEAAKDPSRRNYFFGAHDENRVEFTRGRDLTLAPRQQGQTLNYFIYPYAEVDGKPFTSIDKQFRYHDVARAAK